uniref:Uncharacterized protein n=1 Tax=Octopus bimaculoides TaxID=37653 RepID=A0A0L8H853_OCTBM
MGKIRKERRVRSSLKIKRVRSPMKMYIPLHLYKSNPIFCVIPCFARTNIKY